MLPIALDSLGNGGPHGLSEILYSFASAAGNNGSAFAGLNSNTYFYNVTLGLVMLFARSAILIPSLAVAGNLAAKKSVTPSIGTFATDTFLFGVLLFSVIFIVAALTFFPALSLGPIVEHLLMLKGESF
jgi:potassium-transporting ATPase potassium-binding subunit